MYQADGNQADIRKVLIAAGCSVELIEGANGRAGVPDMLVGRDGRNYVLEVKRPKVGKLSVKQEAWHRCWRGRVDVVRTPEEALRAVGALR
jgi:Holliday junction resolvase